MRQDSSESEAIEVSVCIPAYNEEALIEGTVHAGVTILQRIPGCHEILVVDDGSVDGTWQRLERLREEVPMLRTIRHPTNRGNPAAQRTLVEAARGRYIFHIGADQEWPMTELIGMHATIREGFDIVIGVRTRSSYSLGRRLLSACFNGGVRLLWGADFGDLGSVKLARAELWKRLPARSDSAFIHAERLLAARSNGARIARVPVEHRTRRAGSSSYGSLKEAWRAFLDMLHFRASGSDRMHLTDDR